MRGRRPEMWQVFVTLMAGVVVAGHGGDEVGVCFTRNMVNETSGMKDFGVALDQWRELFVSALSLKVADDSLKTCVFTEASAAAVEYVSRELAVEFRSSLARTSLDASAPKR